MTKRNQLSIVNPSLESDNVKQEEQLDDALPVAVSIGDQKYDVVNSTVTGKIIDKSNNNEVSPEDEASCISKVFFNWAGKITTKSMQKRKIGKELEMEDVPPLPEKLKLEPNIELFNEIWNKQVKKARQNNNGKDPSYEDSGKVFEKAIFEMEKKRVIVGALFVVLTTIIDLAYPLLISQLLESLADIYEDDKYYFAYMIAGIFSFGGIVKPLGRAGFIYMATIVGINWRSTVSAMIYKKALRLSVASKQKYSLGQIVNHMQLDTVQLEHYAELIHFIWSLFVLMVVYIVILYTLAGVSTFVGVGFLFVLGMPITRFLIGRVNRAEKKVLKHTDSRVNFVNEMLSGVLGVKLSSWESKIKKRILQFRKNELSQYHALFRALAWTKAITLPGPQLASVLTISLFVFWGGSANAQTLYAIIVTFRLLEEPIIGLPNILSMRAMYKVSTQRIASFLLAKELVYEETLLKNPVRNAIEIDNGNFHWGRMHKEDNPKEKKKKSKLPCYSSNDVLPVEETEGEITPILEKVNVEFAKGDLTAIVGKVGCGKSSLCGAILNEMVKISGTVAVEGTIAYVAQTAWLLNASIRDNIVFGEEFDEERYHAVLLACELEHDLNVFEFGDQTMIGENGVNISGGQKQRISLARAAYAQTDIVILDDPLSALDPGVASKVFRNCIQRMMAGRTRILVTNQVNLLPECDYVVVLSKRSLSSGPIQDNDDDKTVVSESSSNDLFISYISEQGTYAHLMGAGLGFAKSMKKSKHVSNSESERNSTEEIEGVIDLNSKATNKLMKDEERAIGAVTFDVYKQFIKNGGGFILFIGILLLIVIGEFMKIFNTYWVSYWVDSAAMNYTELIPFEDEDEVLGISGENFYIAGYAITGIFLSLYLYFPSISLYNFVLRSSKSIHEKLLQSVLHGRMEFFDTTPIGRVLSRFSKDVSEADRRLSGSFFAFTSLVVGIVGAVVAISANLPEFLYSFLPLILLFAYVVKLYRPTIRDLKRIESISRSPIFAHFSESLNGLSTIRAYKKELEFETSNIEKLELSAKNYYCMRLLERWLQVRLDLLSSSLVSVTAVLCVYFTRIGLLTPAIAGFVLANVITVGPLIYFSIRVLSQVEVGMNSIERLLYYVRYIPQEAPFTSDKTPENSWPENGSIVVSNLKMRYRNDTPLVLQGISFSVNSGERVGVVGRTGSGKSSLLLCLLRIVEPEPSATACLTIDGVDITRIGLSELRSKISIIPQHPLIFSGTIRTNMDPFGQCSDSQIWEALEKCHLKEYVTSFPEKLNMAISEGGSNLSQGQRQLLCLGRVLLEKSKILFMDEATSSIDHETDVLVQETIRSKDAFNGCTILTIAHRIDTIIDNDRILVLGDGKVLEYDAPSQLLKSPSSEFYSMVQEQKNGAKR